MMGGVLGYNYWNFILKSMHLPAFCKAIARLLVLGVLPFLLFPYLKLIFSSFFPSTPLIQLGGLGALWTSQRGLRPQTHFGDILRLRPVRTKTRQNEIPVRTKVTKCDTVNVVKIMQFAVAKYKIIRNYVDSVRAEKVNLSVQELMLLLSQLSTSIHECAVVAKYEN